MFGSTTGLVGLPRLARLVDQHGLGLAARFAGDPPADARSVAVVEHVLAPPLSDTRHLRLPYALPSPARASSGSVAPSARLLSARCAPSGRRCSARRRAWRRAPSAS